MGKIKIARIILSALSAVLTAAKAVIDFIGCINKLKTETA
ncbi:hypothetical protein SATMO3_20460 [Sporomusa aerivorans]